jgi:hypothetical protein
MGIETRPKRVPSRRVLEAIDDGLEEIRFYFGWGNSDTANTASPKGEPNIEEESAPDEDDSLEEEDEEDYLEGEEYDDQEGSYIDREEIEVAVDAFISSLLASSVIRKAKSGKLPSFGMVFTKFFGRGDLVDLATAFEDDIEGYMGWISPDEMQSAKKRFIEICEFVRDMLEEKAHGR